MKNKLKIIVGLLLVVFLLIQLIIPEQNTQNSIGASDTFFNSETDVNVVTSLQSACYDCHSANTMYPWYAKIAPISWVIANHIKGGKKHLNFSDWSNYTTDKKLKKLLEIEEMIKEGEMPPKIYLMLHKEAKLSDENKQKIFDWLQELKEEIHMTSR